MEGSKSNRVASKTRISRTNIKGEAITTADQLTDGKGSTRQRGKGDCFDSAKLKGSPSPTKKRGWDEIESLFDDGKKAKKKMAQEQEEKKKQGKRHAAAAAAASSGRRSDSKQRLNHRSEQNKSEWINDGLGGVYNSEGFTGRVQDGMKIFKTHVLQSNPNAGTSPDCPFDCNCCFI